MKPGMTPGGQEAVFIEGGNAALVMRSDTTFFIRLVFLSSLERCWFSRKEIGVQKDGDWGHAWVSTNKRPYPGPLRKQGRVWDPGAKEYGIDLLPLREAKQGKLTTRPFSHSPEGLPDRGSPCRRREKWTSRRLHTIHRSTAKGLLRSVKSAACRRISIFLESKVLFPLGADWAPYRERPPPKMACRFHSPARREHPLFPGEKLKKGGKQWEF